MNATPLNTLTAHQFAYIIIFLRNGGERIRAIWLAKNWFNIPLSDAVEWVDHMEMTSEPRRTYIDHEDNGIEKVLPPRHTASHWPEIVTNRMKDALGSEVAS